MGFKLASLFVEVGADDSSLNRTLGAIRGKLARVAATKLNIPGGGFAAMLGLGGAGLGLKSIIDDAVDMESKMATLAKATDLEGAALGAMKAELLRLSVAIKGVRINDLLDIATAGAKLGVAAGELPAYTEGVAKVAAAMDDIPAGVIAEEIGKLNSVFKLGVPGTMQFGSAIDKLADSGVSSAKNILDVTQRISGTAVAARITAQESTALAAALLDTGTNAELGATSLQRLLMSLNSPDLKDRKNFAKILNTDMGTFAKTVQDKPMAAIRQFLTAIKGMDAQSQQAAIGSIGVENIHGIGEIQKLAQQVDVLDKYVGMANHEFQTLDQITKSYAASAGTTKAQIATMQNQLQILGDRVGSSLLPAVNSGLSLLGELATGLGEMWGRASEGVKGWGVDFSGVFELVGFGLRNMADLFERAGTMIGGGFLNTWEALSYGGEVVGAVAKYIWGEMVAAFQIIIGAAANAKDNIVNVFTEVWEYIKSMGSNPIEFKLKPILDGVQVKDADWKMPQFRGLTSVNNQVEAIDQRIAAREAARTGGLEGAAKGAVPGGPAAAGATAGANKFATGGTTTKVGVTDIDAYARELTEGALKGGGDIGQSQLKVQESMDKNLATIAKNTEKSGGRPAVVWQ